MSNITSKAASNCLRNSFETHGLLHVILTDNEHLLVRDESCKPFDMSFVSYLHYVETILACLTYHMCFKKLTCHTDLPNWHATRTLRTFYVKKFDVKYMESNQKVKDCVEKNDVTWHESRLFQSWNKLFSKTSLPLFLESLQKNGR